MRIRHVKPHPVLAPYIDRFWSWEADRGECVTLPTVLPGTGAELFFHYGTPFHYDAANRLPAQMPAAHLLCVRRMPVRLLPAAGIGFVAIRFRAGGIHRFTDVRGAALIDRPHTPQQLWGASGRQLVRQVQSAADAAASVAILQRHLLAMLQPDGPDSMVVDTVARIYRDAPTIAISALPGAVGYRQLLRRFAALTGQTPAEVRQASRLQKVVRAVLLDAGSTPLDAALSHGFYDQSHFVHAFRAWSGMTPARFFNAARAASHFYNTSIAP